MHTAKSSIIDIAGIRAAIIRSKRKTAAINVRDGKVSIRVPMKFPKAAAVEFLELKRDWIQRKLHQQQQVLVANTRAFVDGETFAYLGRKYRLEIKHAKHINVELKGDVMLAYVTQDHAGQEAIRSVLIKWYKGRAAKLLSLKVEQFQSRVGVMSEKVTIRTCKSRWGSCSMTGRLMFNWKIMLAPEPVVDYLVVHELCHMLEHNHSPRFWQQVEKVLPAYTVQRRWLRDNGRYLEL